VTHYGHQSIIIDLPEYF